MDTAVALVETYLRLNGYLTVTEYPILEVSGRDETRTVSDLDVLAFRFPAAGHELHPRRHGALRGDLHEQIDPALGASPGQADMIVGEVKRGQARFNPATRNAEVLAAGLLRFGCCPANDALPSRAPCSRAARRTRFTAIASAWSLSANRQRRRPTAGTRCRWPRSSPTCGAT